MIRSSGSIRDTLFKINVIHARTDRTETEALKLIEVGFEYVCTIGKVKLFRKRK
jgi:hypothetical protein